MSVIPKTWQAIADTAIKEDWQFVAPVATNHYPWARHGTLRIMGDGWEVCVETPDEEDDTWMRLAWRRVEDASACPPDPASWAEENAQVVAQAAADWAEAANRENAIHAALRGGIR